MKAVILAGGLGTRMSELTKTIPKPMVTLNNKPILIYIMEHYYNFGVKEFYVAIGYKGSQIKKHFKKNKYSWKVNLINTGLKTMTGGRLKRLKKYLKKETFLLTYGDGVSDVNIKKLIQFHKKEKGFATLTAVRPPARFGAIKLKKSNVEYFREKSKLDEGWINGGFFVFEPNIFDLIKSDKTFLEREPMEKLAKNKKLKAYKHEGFWQCIDTKRDRDLLEEKFKKK
ncbi:MAG: glucose-1-phosphate cytidylyltransferase [Candidatus Pelagibacter sp.]|nr:glucose-1-phosphate cytidylyltransferase [Candidatus Pelagibacter sp.]